MTNFDFLQSEPKFDSFSGVAVAAEKILPIDFAASVVNCRRAMEFAVKWMYSVDRALVKPWDDKLVTLMSTDEFRDIVGNDLYQRMNFIRKVGNHAAHGDRAITKDQAMLCLENLYDFMDFVAYCYADNYEEGRFHPELVGQDSVKVIVPAETELKLDQLMKENAALRERLTERREEQKQTYVPKPLEESEYETRKL